MARLLRTLSIPIILLWLLLAAALAMISPPLEEVATQHAVSMTPQAAPAFKAMMHIGRVFHEFDSDSTAMVVLEGQDKLGDSAHDYYNRIVGQLNADTAHVENVQDFWSDPLTAAGSQSPDGKAAYVQVFLHGKPRHHAQHRVGYRGAQDRRPDTGTTWRQGIRGRQHRGHRRHEHRGPQEPGDTGRGLDRRHLRDVLLVYRSIVTTILCVVIVGIELFARRGVTGPPLAISTIIGLTSLCQQHDHLLSIAAARTMSSSCWGAITKPLHRARIANWPSNRLIEGVPRHPGLGADHRGACLCLTQTRCPISRPWDYRAR